MQWLHWQGMQWHATLHSFVATKLALVLSVSCANIRHTFMVVNTLECILKRRVVNDRKVAEADGVNALRLLSEHLL